MGQMESVTPIKDPEHGMVTVKDMLKGRKTSLNPTTRNGLNTYKTQEKFGNLKQALRNVFEAEGPQLIENTLNRFASQHNITPNGKKDEYDNLSLGTTSHRLHKSNEHHRTSENLHRRKQSHDQIPQRGKSAGLRQH